MRKTEQIKTLLESNREVLLHGDEKNGICYDGIVDEKEYDETNIKLAVLLKETNGNDSDGKQAEKLNDWDYLMWIREQQAEGIVADGEKRDPFYSSTFRKLCLWITEFFDIAGTGDCDIENYICDGNVRIDKIRMNLKKIALINLKKSWGIEKTDGNELYKYATDGQIKTILQRQMEIAKPDIVLCCSPIVFDIAKEVYGTGSTSYHQETSNVIKNKQKEYMVIDNTIYINFYHPSWYGKSDVVLGEFAKEVFKWVLEERRRIIK